MKRTLVVLATLAVLLTVACATTTPPTTAGLVTGVDGSSITVTANGAPVTYNITRSTNIYAADGVMTKRSYLTQGQRVQVWANGNQAVRINIEP